MRLGWITDIHLDFMSKPAARAYVRRLRDSGADAVAVSGDIAQAATVAGWLDTMATAIERPIYFVLGNHDYYGSSIQAVRERVAACVRRSKGLTWLEVATEPVALTGDSGLIGHGGWGDARHGDYDGSSVELNDFYMITELIGLSQEPKRQELQRLGNEAAAHLKRVLPSALDRFQHIIVLCHVPPFREAAWHEGRLCDKEFLPFFSCKAVGDVLLEQMRDRPDRRMAVLCGHTHSGGNAKILENLLVLTGSAAYGTPAIQSLMEVL